MSKNPKNSKQRTCHIVSHTHWDREWRYTFWQTQLFLIDFIDELIDVLETGKYPAFLMDGQAAPVLDYLKLKPEMTDRVKKLVSAGKLQIGPWYVLPDEFPVDGEALVRNLLLGARKSRELGGRLDIGYTSFGWGQIAQFPQIYSGFGMDVLFIGKRVSPKRAPKSEFIWRGPDGTEVLTSRFGGLGRNNFYMTMHMSAIDGIDFESPHWRYYWENGGTVYHRADLDEHEQDYFQLEAPNKWHMDIVTEKMLDFAWDTTNESVIEDDRLLMDGSDYTASQPMLPELIKRINEIDAENNRKWVHTDITKFVEIMKAKIDRKKLSIVEGRLRDGPACDHTGNALASRLYLKQLNKKAQNMLIRFAEPLSVLATMTVNAMLPKNLLDKAWDYLILSHPHDSINGVTQDKTVRDVCGRLDQVVDISRSMGNLAMKAIVKNIDTSKYSDDEVIMVVFNPLPYSRSEVVEAYVDIPMKEQPLLGVDLFFGQKVRSRLHVFDADDNPIGNQVQGVKNLSIQCQTIRPYIMNVSEIHGRSRGFFCENHRIFFETGEIPACGYKTFKLKTIPYGQQMDCKWGDGISVFRSETSNILTSPNCLENEHLKVEMNCNGTFNLTDKKTGHTAKNMNYYQDWGENGTYWENMKPMWNETYNSLGCNAEIWAEETGPLQATLVSQIVMKIPGRGDKFRRTRCKDMVEMKIKTTLTLKAGSRQVDIRVDFDNQARDHYFRAMFPTGLTKARFADIGGHFTVEHNPIRPEGPTDTAVWPDMGTLPFNYFVDVSDGRLGMAFINDSLTEYEVLDNDERTVGLSLLRAVHESICIERTSKVYESQEGSQCLGPQKATYAIRLHDGNWQEADLETEAKKFNAPVRVIQTNSHKGKLPGDEFSMFEIENSQIQFSTLKWAQDRKTFVVRLYNPTNEIQKGKLKFAAKISKAWLTDLDEKRTKEIQLLKNGSIPVTAGPHKIVTIEYKA